MYTLSQPRPADAGAIDALLDASFGADRHLKTSYRYRDGVAPLADLALVAHEGARPEAATGPPRQPHPSP